MTLHSVTSSILDTDSEDAIQHQFQIFKDLAISQANMLASLIQSLRKMIKIIIFLEC